MASEIIDTQKFYDVTELIGILQDFKDRYPDYTLFVEISASGHENAAWVSLKQTNLTDGSVTFDVVIY